MAIRCLIDKNVYPDDDVLTRYLGKAKSVWDAFMDLLKTDYPSVSTEWRYYNDGKSWLCKTTQKKKTLCWISVWEGFYKVTFYFDNKAEESIRNSSIKDKLKECWLNLETKLKIKPITIEVSKKTQLKVIKELIELKGKVK